MSVEVRDHRDHAVVTVTGEILEDSVALLRRTVDDVCAMYSRMVLDVGGASFPDNLALRELLRIRERIAAGDHSVRIVGMTEALRRRADDPSEGTPEAAPEVAPEVAPPEVAPPETQAPRVKGVLAVEAPETDEAVAVARVVERVSSRFPSSSGEEVARVVAVCYHEFDGTPIREFIPILVEREATAQLRAVDRQSAG